MIKLLEHMGFEVVQVNEPYYRMRHPDGRATTIPVYPNRDISKGLLRKIIREDIGITMEEFVRLLK